MATPIVLKKPLRVYKVGKLATLGIFISQYQNFRYYKSQIMPTVKIRPKFERCRSVMGCVGQLSRIVPYRSPSERFMCATLSLTLFFHMEKKDGTYDNREVYVHGFPIKL